MPIDKVFFYSEIRNQGLFKQLTQLQVDSIDAILLECELQGVTIPAQIAYVLATAYWEAHNPRKPELRMTPMIEYGGNAYLRSKPYYPYFGRGFSQLTWPENYKKEGKRLKLDLVKSPDLILDVPIAANSHVYCMKNGSYTGKKLSDYITSQKEDLINARRIVNAKDRASEIANIAIKFKAAIKSLP